jgi:hypothetical protein
VTFHEHHLLSDVRARDMGSKGPGMRRSSSLSAIDRSSSARYATEIFHRSSTVGSKARHLFILLRCAARLLLLCIAACPCMQCGLDRAVQAAECGRRLCHIHRFWRLEGVRDGGGGYQQRRCRPAGISSYCNDCLLSGFDCTALVVIIGHVTLSMRCGACRYGSAGE